MIRMFNAAEYDSWYERHPDFFRAELEALRPLVIRYPEPGLEIGVGTGRFAAELGIGHGIDPDEQMLELAKKRGIKTERGYGEALPYRSESFGKVLIITAFPFFSAPEKVAKEVHRVLIPGGGLIIGMLPRNGYFGRKYMAAGKEGDIRFKNAHFYTPAEILALLRPYFKFEDAYSTLMGEPPQPDVVKGTLENAGFVAMAWRKVSKKF